MFLLSFKTHTLVPTLVHPSLALGEPWGSGGNSPFRVSGLDGEANAHTGPSTKQDDKGFD